jgi:hypothetical protein
MSAWQRCSPVDNEPHGDAKLLFNFEVENFQVANEETQFRVWVDCLLWLRSSLAAPVFEYDIVLAESFFPIRSNFLMMSNVQVISPLIDFDQLPQKDQPNGTARYILISFGGVETPYTQDIHRVLIPSRVLQATVEASEALHDTRPMICCAPASLCQQLSNKNTVPRVRFLSPNHGEYLALLRGADLNIVQPGLFGPFEAFAARVPTVFCPPFSYTQLCQARKYEEYGLLGEVPLWSSFDREMGSYDGDLKTEEPACFQHVAAWFEENLGPCEHRDAFLGWARRALEGSLATSELTKRRANHIESCTSFPETHLSVLSQLLL